MQTEVSNTKDNHEMMLENGTCMSCVIMTILLIQITLFLKDAKSVKVDAF